MLRTSMVRLPATAAIVDLATSRQLPTALSIAGCPAGIGPGPSIAERGPALRITVATATIWIV